MRSGRKLYPMKEIFKKPVYIPLLSHLGAAYSRVNPLNFVSILEKSKKKEDPLYGKVTSACNAKTVAVNVGTIKIHERVGKAFYDIKKYQVHDPKEEAVVGDWVRIVPGSKRGKSKNHIISGVVIPASRFKSETGINFTQTSPLVRKNHRQLKKKFMDCLYGMTAPVPLTNVKMSVKLELEKKKSL